MGRNRRKITRPSGMIERPDHRVERIPIPIGIPDRPAYVGVVAPGTERKVERAITDQGGAAWCPRYRTTAIIRRRKVEIERPVFPRYVLMWPGPSGWGSVRLIPELVDVLSTSVDGGDEVPLAIAPREFDRIVAEHQAQLPLDPVPEVVPFVVGDRIKMRDATATFAGWQGVIEAINGKRALVAFAGLGGAFQITADLDQMERVAA